MAATLQAQIQEPEVIRVERSVVNLNDNYKHGITLDVLLNNFGFAVGTEYRRVLGRQTEGVINFRIAGLRDASEQTFTDVFFGQQVTPNKFQRAFTFPLLFGVRQRLFASQIQENYRFFLTAKSGPVAAFTFPYFRDRNNNGFRETGFERPTPNSPFGTPERINDIFSGWSDGEWHLGAAGEIAFGVDVGRNFSGVTSLEFGYFFNFYPNGIQMMMPNQPDLREVVGPNQTPFQFDEDGELLLKPFFDKQKFFGTPQITITFGRLWR